MYPSETTFPGVNEHRARSGGTPRAFSDVQQAVGGGAAAPAGISSHPATCGPNRQMDQRSNGQVPEQPSRPVRVFRDAVRNVPGPEYTNRQQPPAPQTGAPPELIVISDDELPPEPGTVGPLLAPPPQGDGPVEVHLTCTGPGSSSSGFTGTVGYNYTHVDAQSPVFFPDTGLLL